MLVGRELLWPTTVLQAGQVGWNSWQHVCWYIEQRQQYRRQQQHRILRMRPGSCPQQENSASTLQGPPANFVVVCVVAGIDKCSMSQ